jgi:RNA polymerase sigma factor (sigma-70 family)
VAFHRGAKSGHRSADIPDEAAGPSTALAAQDDAARLREMLAILPKREREVVRLKFESGLSYHEISAATGLSTSNVGYLLHHAVQKLRAMWMAELV